LRKLGQVRSLEDFLNDDWREVIQGKSRWALKQGLGVSWAITFDQERITLKSPLSMFS
jgi:hypothetical protein